MVFRYPFHIFFLLAAVRERAHSCANVLCEHHHVYPNSRTVHENSSQEAILTSTGKFLINCELFYNSGTNSLRFLVETTVAGTAPRTVDSDGL
jgi:hypothetical protein